MASDLPADLLEDIFLRLDDTADLARASAACAAFRRAIISDDRRFLRRFRSLHGTPVLGLLLLLENQHNNRPPCSETTEFLPAPNSQAASGFASAADFTFNFLPDDDPKRCWRVCDVRDGRVLLTRSSSPHLMFEDLVAYDPLHRGHVRIPTIPADLLLQSVSSQAEKDGMSFDDPFLAPPPPTADNDDDSSSSSSSAAAAVAVAARLFRVMCTGLLKTKVVAFVFSSATGQWKHAASFSSSDYVWHNLPCMWERQYVHHHGRGGGLICWAHEGTNDMLVLDTREMRFSMVVLPRKSIRRFKMAVEVAGEEDGRSRLGLLIVNDRPRRRRRKKVDLLDLYSKAWHEKEEEEEWRHDGSITMPAGLNLSLGGAADGHVLVSGVPRDQLKWWIRTREKKPEVHCFTLELRTLLVERLCVLEFGCGPKFLYAGFPPPFSLPSI